MKNKKIIISGPPGSGKTTIIDELRNRGYICMPEVTPKKLNLKIEQNKLILSDFLFSERIKQYHSQNEVACFYDRSLIDVVAYMDFWDSKYPHIWNNEITKLRYNQNVFYTPPWPEIYKKTDHRQENIKEAQQIDLFLRKAFLKYQYNIIEVPKLDVSKRVDFIINNL